MRIIHQWMNEWMNNDGFILQSDIYTRVPAIRNLFTFRPPQIFAGLKTNIFVWRRKWKHNWFFFKSVCPFYEEKGCEVWTHGTSLHTKLWGHIDDIPRTAGFDNLTRPARLTVEEEEQFLESVLLFVYCLVRLHLNCLIYGIVCQSVCQWLGVAL